MEILNYWERSPERLEATEETETVPERFDFAEASLLEGAVLNLSVKED